MNNKHTNAMKKRQKIEQSNKTMFVMIATASAVVGLCLVVSWMLFQQLQFTIAIVDVQSNALKSLEKSNKNIKSLAENIRVLETNQGLNAVKAAPENKALQSVLDALPADSNSLALGASIQERLLKGIDDLSIESLVIGGSDSTSSLSVVDSGEGELPFRLVVTASSARTLQTLLERFEKSIRVIDIDDMLVERSENRYTLTIQAHAYYEPAMEVKLGKETVKLGKESKEASKSNKASEKGVKP